MYQSMVLASRSLSVRQGRAVAPHRITKSMNLDGAVSLASLFSYDDNYYSAAFVYVP